MRPSAAPDHVSQIRPPFFYLLLRWRGPAGWLRASVLLAALLSTSMQGPLARASDARREGLAGNLAFEDDTDLHAFPQLAARYGDRGSLDVADQGAVFRGGVVLGERSALGLFLNRPVSKDWFGPVDDFALLRSRIGKLDAAIGGVDAPAGTVIEEPFPLLDLKLGLRRGYGFGIRVANSMDQRVRRIPAPAIKGSDPRTIDAEEGTQSTAVVLCAGWSERRVSRSYDLAAHLSFNHIKTVSEGKIRAESSLTPSLLLLARGTTRSSPTLSWTGLAQLYLRTYDLELPYHSNSVEEGLLGLRVAAGPRVALGDGVRLVALAWLGAEKQSYALSRSVESGRGADGRAGMLADEASDVSYLLPGLDLGIEVEVAEWLSFRAGWRSRYLLRSSETGPDERVDAPLLLQPGYKEGSSSGLEQAWAAGLTASFGKFRADASLAPALLNTGPDSIGGKAPGTFTWVSLSYAWGSGPARPEPDHPATRDLPRRRPTRRPPSSPYPPEAPSPGARPPGYGADPGTYPAPASVPLYPPPVQPGY